MLGIVFELVLSFVQFSSTILVPPSNAGSEDFFPPQWKDPMFYMSFLNLGFDIITDIISSLGDLRVYFMTICVALPLAMMIFGLFFLNSKKVVIWYFLMLAFFLALCVGACARAISSTVDINISNQVAEILLYVGIGGTALCWGLFLLGYCGFLGKLSRDNDAKINQRQRMELTTRSFDWQTTLKHVAIVAVTVVIGLLFINVIEVPDLIDDIDLKVTSKFAFGIGVALLVVGGISFFFLVFSLFRKGRELVWRFREFMMTTFLNILLLGLSFLYIPIGAATFSIFNCNTVTCPIGFRIPDVGMSTVLNATFGKCIPCDIDMGQMCPSDIKNTICGGMTDDRLETDLFIGCSGVRNFFWPAGALVILFYIVGVPLLFFFEIRTSTRLLRDDFPIKEPVREEDESQSDYEQRRWELKVLMSDNSARFLFEAFEYRFRYMRLMQLIQKLIVVFTTVFVIRYNDWSPRFIVLGISLAVHSVVTLVFVAFRPFLLNIHDALATVLQAGLCAVIIVALLVAANVEVPAGVLTATMVVNFGLPGLSMLVGFIYFCFSKHKETEEEEAEMRRRAEIEARAAEDPEFEASRSRMFETPNSPFSSSMTTVTGSIRSSPSASTAHSPLGSVTTKKADRQKRMRKEIRERVQQQLKAEADELKERQMDSDAHINQRMQKQLRIFLMTSGVIATIALGLCVLGLWSSKKTEVRSSFEGDMDIQYQLAGYPNWGNFTSSCCCASSKSAYDWSSQRSAPVDVEIWMCANGVTQERTRSYVFKNTTDDTMNEVNGFDLRPLCSDMFANGCKLLNEGSSLAFECPQAVPPELEKLW